MCIKYTPSNFFTCLIRPLPSQSGLEGAADSSIGYSSRGHLTAVCVTRLHEHMPVLFQTLWGSLLLRKGEQATWHDNQCRSSHDTKTSHGTGSHMIQGLIHKLEALLSHHLRPFTSCGRRTATTQLKSCCLAKLNVFARHSILCSLELGWATMWLMFCDVLSQLVQ
jgi:hypothetical protein